MGIEHKKLKRLTFTLASNQFQCQISNWRLVNNTEPGEKFYTFCGPEETGEFREDAEQDWSLELTFFSDWQLNGINDYLTTNDQATVGYVIDHHVGEAGWQTRRTGQVKIMAPSAGGEARTTETTEITLPCIGKPTYARL